MALLAVDESQCGLCGLCAAACPAGLISTGLGAPVPASAEQADEECCRCGHCVAVCPTAALEHRDLPAKDCMPIDQQLVPAAAEVAQLLRSRRSVRSFTGEPVQRSTLSSLLDIARYAPSGCNAQPVHWTVLYDTQQVRRVAEMVVDGLRRFVAENPQAPLAAILTRLIDGWDSGVNTVSRGAPHLILAHASQADPLSQSACTIAQTYLEVAASAFGLGACWMGLVDMTANCWPPLRDYLALPERHAVMGTLAIGHPAFSYARIPPRAPLRVEWK